MVQLAAVGRSPCWAGFDVSEEAVSHQLVLPKE